ncbi:hypothetical protein GCM10007921_10150 [Tritonibacter mobilis]|nr:hypothetical protein GCM10007921_10150 [Tritonibacter mobilis]SDW71492.1 hypothetical protein SAMN05444385_103186 [Tritonibacter mobilis]
MNMERDDSNYLDALKEAVEQSKASIGISSVPLGIILLQLKYLAEVSSLLLKLLATMGVFTLFAATILAWFLAITFQSTYAMEVYNRNGVRSEKGNKYAAWIVSYGRGGSAFGEEHLINVSRTLVGPFWILCLIGYACLIMFILALIWQTPAEAAQVPFSSS